VKIERTTNSVPTDSRERDQAALVDLQARLRDQVQEAASKCARALSRYIGNNARLLFADTLPPVEAEELRSSLTAYVDTLRVLGAPPERVIIAVKELVRGAAADARVDARGLTSAAVTWAIAGYFPRSTSDDSALIDSNRDALDAR
jgi:hypothetical protein